MNSPLYLVAQIGFASVTFIFFGFLLKELKSGLMATGWDSVTQKKIYTGTWIALAAWMAVVSALSLSGFLQNFDAFPPRMIIVLMVPLITIIWVSSTKKLTHILQHVPPQNIVRLQVFRVFVEILLWLLFIIDLLPKQMTFEGRNFDVLAGLTAPLVAYFCFTSKRWPRSIAIAWNFLSLGLLINIVTIALLSVPTPFRYFMNEPANTIVAHFPIVWLPAFLVPLAYSLHIFSLKQLLGKKRPVA
jgi:hypothetical protein